MLHGLVGVMTDPVVGTDSAAFAKETDCCMASYTPGPGPRRMPQNMLPVTGEGVGKVGQRGPRAVTDPQDLLSLGWMWWCMLSFQPHGKLRQKNLKFQDSPSTLVTLWPQNLKN